MPACAAAAAAPRARRAGRALDALIDAIATLALEAPVSGEMLLAHLPATRRAGSKPFPIEGLNASSGEWEAPRRRASATASCRPACSWPTAAAR